MIESRPLVAMIHAVPTGASTAKSAFDREFPEARVWNLLDDRLLGDARSAGRLTEALRRRMLRLIGHAVDGGAQGLLLTCSSYGEVVDTARTLWHVPLLKADEAMFRVALAGDWDRIAVVASTPPAVPAAAAQLEALAPAVRSDRPVEIVTALSEDAGSADDPLAAARHLARALHSAGAADVQAVLLAQYSLAPAGPALADLLGVPVLDGAGAAAVELRGLLTGPTEPDRPTTAAAS
ncbi:MULTISPECIES: aspartate/glutamate racemase family protein [Nocardiopsidaceae]|uniref:Aspartate/glutamate racemase family protein n=1 Tax=Streptomonospora nanhaiensis TaxID=1323731 RepID=A0ABY6YUY8_9ACTN|nr:aspartate/glutamate racemase family protein [Streptomonospora nanhaiensis]WAE75806.1 aspartate/glutamate racemase family protein [Streptomonospora nanhaiensis]